MRERSEWLQLRVPREDRTTFNIASSAALNQSSEFQPQPGSWDLSQDYSKNDRYGWQ
jgi:hypothetical protein